ncbi:helix-turn-helix transcriptional regulator [Streptomyces sp. NPDC006356]
MQIRRLREERGYSLEELAERSGLSFRGLIYIEHGQRSPSVLTLWTSLQDSMWYRGNSSITSPRKNPANLRLMV